jgi:hypothetical protein
MKDYDGYNFDEFKKLAKNDDISKYQKIGFPDSYRKGVENKIFEDILAKVPLLSQKKRLNVLDIGPGCSDLPGFVIDYCRQRDHHLFLADSLEMLNHIADQEHITKIPGLFPDTLENIKSKSDGIDVIICYSVFHYIFVDSNVWTFIDSIMSLLNDRGECLIGDIPNISKRKRFFASNTGVKFHQSFMKTDEKPKVEFNCLETGKIDDSLLNALVQRCQLSGYNTYLVPQNNRLPFANRRDDLIIRKP